MISTRFSGRSGACSVLALLLVLTAGCAQKNSSHSQGDGHDHSHDQGAAATPASDPSTEAATSSAEAAGLTAGGRDMAMQMATYPVSTCVVCNADLASQGGAVDRLHEGRLVRTCCADCQAKFEAAPSGFLETIDAAVIAAQKSGYPLETCLVEGGKLGAKGEPVAKIHGTRLVQFCCSDCGPEFDKNPAAALAQLDAAYIEKQKASYVPKQCPLMNRAELGSMGEPVDILYGNRLVRLCCADCIEGFWKDPVAAIAAVDEMQKPPPLKDRSSIEG